jgi:hypothetical protein
LLNAVDHARLLDTTGVVLLAAAVHHHLKLAIVHRGATHRDVGDDSQFVLAVIKRNHRVDRVCARVRSVGAQAQSVREKQEDDKQEHG